MGILQLIGSQQFHLQQLLETICERFPSNCSGSYVKVTCPNHEDHFVSPFGFVLLEQVEAANGSSELNVDMVYTNCLIRGPLISALKSMVDCWDFICKTQNDAEALLSLVQHAKVFGLARLAILAILGPIGEGWFHKLDARQKARRCEGSLGCSICRKPCVDIYSSRCSSELWQGVRGRLDAAGAVSG